MQDAEGLLSGREYEVPSAPVLELSQRSGCPAYDCESVHLAQHPGIGLVTSDRRVLDAFPDVAVSPQDFTR
jgi:predicted nucleic acid-binding protein